MSLLSHARGLLRGAHATGMLLDARTPGDGAAAGQLGPVPLEETCRSLIEWNGFDGRDQARRVEAIVASRPERCAVLERLVAAMVGDGAPWHEPARLLQRTLAAQRHDGTLRALAAAVAAPDNESYRRWLAEQLVAVTHRSSTAAGAAVVAVEVAASWLRGDGPRGGVAYEPLAARSIADPASASSACAVEVVRAVVSVVAAAPRFEVAVETVRDRWWGDDAAAVLAGALFGARAGEAAVPAPSTETGTRLDAVAQVMLALSGWRPDVTWEAV
jgi:hypothetical protein